MTILYYANKAEQDAVAWFKRQRHRGGAQNYALLEVAYDPCYAGTDWRRGRVGFGGFIPRSRIVGWRLRPYGHPSMNEAHMRALQCFRRNAYFRDFAKKIGKRNWNAQHEKD